ncbi:aminotransferase [Pseudomonas mosselii]|uniref:aminotransferase n=1 Tax=Pseudomonas mosselii TaxID=78327 RepID=UPI001BD3CB0B|nr:aminotransferase [Pseudomonas mosselii]MBS9762762.1 aminotransferase [Pseudomonas mosselii]
MHTYKLPKAVLGNWLEDFPSTVGDYGHLLLEQVGSSDAEVVKALRPYFESAHLDAREHFHEEICIDLHPDADAPGSHATYPTCLPRKTRRGLFGEVLSGMLTEHYPFVGGHNWQVPIFLFRHHEDVRNYLFALARDSGLTREVLGRHGSDFLAVAFDADGSIKRYLAGEAKWRKTLGKGVVNALLKGQKGKGGIWYQLNERDKNIPHGMRQLQRLLKARDPVEYEKAILSIDEALLVKDPKPIPRTNLILIAGIDYSSRASGTSIISQKVKPVDYLSEHDLQVVELFLADDGEDLIDAIYDSLWKEPEV